ncbi:hypothetical protein DQ04_00921140 [Trypanosoma grayi]|uniref:hypothetical protein n=1 Tax=Trypanosoma grayi TaxID=71804 RepID=UPI0004F46151|nr:hypothetical protein DQ04_00921140 [Trypanosoma grayi]KEG13580.1 hypothetical protein DQ04_00921140 [Trypanosoma grayi]
MIKRAFFSHTFVCRNGCLATSSVRCSLLSDVALRSAFRRVCAEEGVGLQEGVSEEILASAIAQPGLFSVEDAKTKLRLSSAVTVDGGMVFMTADGGRELGEVESVLMKVAAKIPPSGVSGSQLQAILEDEAPYFQPSAMGALSLKDAIQAYPNVFIVDTDSTGKWMVRAAGSARPSVPVTSRGPLRIVDFCRRRALLGQQSSYTPLRVAMQKTDLTDKGLLRELVTDEEASKALEVRLSVSVKPKRSPANAFCFIDGSEIGTKAVDAMWKGLCLSDQSTRIVARHPASPKHSSTDIVAPEEMPTYAVLELKAKELTMRHSVILQDIIYMCSSRQFVMYSEHVAKLNAFPDSDVYVCCPSRVELVAEKQYVPL